MLGAVQGVLLVAPLFHKLVACWGRRKFWGRQALDTREEHEGPDFLRHCQEKSMGIREWPGDMLSFPKFCVRPPCLGKWDNRISSKPVPEWHLRKIGAHHSRTELSARRVGWIDVDCVFSSSGLLCLERLRLVSILKLHVRLRLLHQPRLVYTVHLLSLIIPFLY